MIIGLMAFVESLFRCECFNFGDVDGRQYVNLQSQFGAVVLFLNNHELPELRTEWFAWQGRKRTYARLHKLVARLWFFDRRSLRKKLSESCRSLSTSDDFDELDYTD